MRWVHALLSSIKDGLYDSTWVFAMRQPDGVAVDTRRRRVQHSLPRTQAIQPAIRDCSHLSISGNKVSSHISLRVKSASSCLPDRVERHLPEVSRPAAGVSSQQTRIPAWSPNDREITVWSRLSSNASPAGSTRLRPPQVPVWCAPAGNAGIDRAMRYRRHGLADAVPTASTGGCGRFARWALAPPPCAQVIAHDRGTEAVEFRHHHAAPHSPGHLVDEPAQAGIVA